MDLIDLMIVLCCTVQYAGFTVSPAIGSSMVSNFTPDSYWLYALPAYFIAFMVIINRIVHNRNTYGKSDYQYSLPNYTQTAFHTMY